MGVLTWRNVDAPDFRSAMEGYKIASDQLNSAFSAARGGLKDFEAARADEVSSQFAAALSKYQDPKALQAALADGSLVQQFGGKVSAEDINKAGAQVQNLLSTAANMENLDYTKFGHNKNIQYVNADEAANPVRIEYETLRQSNNPQDQARADAILNDPNNKALFANQRPGSFSDMVSGAMRLAGDRQGFEQTGTRFGNEQTEWKEGRDAVTLSGIIRQNGVDPADFDSYVTNNYQALLDKGISPVVIEKARHIVLNDPTAAASFYENGSLGGGSGGGVNTAPIIGSPDAVSAIGVAAQQLGTTPEDLATVISYETGGKFNPDVVGGKNNNYMGLIQFGPEERQKYGIKPGMTFQQQMGAVTQFLKDRGFKPGMGLMDLYSTINSGSPGNYDASDGNGTVRSHVAEMQRTHRANALAFLGAQGTAVTTDIKNDLSGNPRTEMARTFLELWQDKSSAAEAAIKFTGKGQVFEGEDSDYITTKIDQVRQKYGVNSAVAAYILSQSKDGKKSGWNPDTWSINPFGSGIKSSFNEKRIDELGRMARDRDGLRKAAVATQVQGQAIAGIDSSQAAAAQAAQALTLKAQRAARLGRRVSGTNELNAAAQTTAALSQAVGQGASIAVGGARNRGQPNPKPAPAPVQPAAARPAPAPQKKAPAQDKAKLVTQALNTAKAAVQTAQQGINATTPGYLAMSRSADARRAVNHAAEVAMKSGLPLYGQKKGESYSMWRERIKAMVAG